MFTFIINITCDSFVAKKESKGFLTRQSCFYMSFEGHLPRDSSILGIKTSQIIQYLQLSVQMIHEIELNRFHIFWIHNE